MFQPSRLVSPAIRALVAHLAKRWRRRSVWRTAWLSVDKKNQYSIL
jgi:hypothetical protein